MGNSLDIQQNFLQNLTSQCDAGKADRILLAVSGGADSMVMTDLCMKEDMHIGLMHVNFMLRGEESEAEEEMVKNYCLEKNIPFFSSRLDVKAYIKKNPGISIQMAARDLRYAWFEEIRIQEHYDLIATAHHQSDLLETFLIHFTKGTGIGGLHGILPRKKHLIRPMLFLNKDEIYAYAQEEKIPFREDSSNAKEYYLRNNIRLNLIPEFKKINPEIEKTAAENIRKIREVEAIYRAYLEEAIQAITQKDGRGEKISISGLQVLLKKHANASNTLIYEIFKKYGFNNAQSNEILKSMQGKPGIEFFSKSFQLLRDREYFLLEDLKKQEVHQEEIISIDRHTENVATIDLALRISEKNIFLSEIHKSSDFAYLNARELTFPMYIRKWKSGDFFHPSGEGKRKKISDYLIDKKISRHEKNNTYVLISNNQIAWLIGHRIDERFRFKQEQGMAYIIQFAALNTTNDDAGKR